VLHWNGYGWSRVNSGTTANLTAVWGTGPNDVWAVGGTSTTTGSAGSILHWDGSTWTTQSSVLTTTLAGVWGVGVKDVWAVGNRSTASPVPVEVGLQRNWGAGQGITAN